jgi:hypothetical protein
MHLSKSCGDGDRHFHSWQAYYAQLNGGLVGDEVELMFASIINTIFKAHDMLDNPFFKEYQTKARKRSQDRNFLADQKIWNSGEPFHE